MINDSLKISVITPSYNQGSFIEETILSVLNQNYSNLEYIIIDGGSTDNTIEIIKKYESKITYWISEKDSGQSEAINKGLKIATGDIITWLNSDDYYEPKIFEKIETIFMKNENVSIVHGKAHLFGENIKNRLIGLDCDIPYHHYLSFMRFPQPSSFFSKSIIDKISPVNNKLHYAMDFELVVKSVLLNGAIIRINDVLSNYRIHKHSKTNDDLKFLNEWNIVVSQLFKSFPNGAFYVTELENLNLLSKDSFNLYNSNITLSNFQLEEVFLQHLNLHYHYQYKVFNYLECKKISYYLSINYPRFYLENNYSNFNFRLKFIPKFIFNFIKKIKK